MRLLLDTHIALASVLDDPSLPRAARLLFDGDNEMFVSVVSLWEIAIKFSLRRGRLHEMPMSSGEALEHFHASNFGILDITASHALAVEQLPRLHADPFDRLLIAQALTEPLRLVTKDSALAAYGDTILAV